MVWSFLSNFIFLCFTKDSTFLPTDSRPFLRSLLLMTFMLLVVVILGSCDFSFLRLNFFFNSTLSSDWLLWKIIKLY
jgi:hypothetical protein